MAELSVPLQGSLGGRYDIERELGRGGMATVYLARDLKQGRQVAVKVLNPDLALVLGAERFLREIRIASGLTHPHILPVYDSGEAEGTLFYVMPFVEGESLRDRLSRERQLGVDEALRITCEVAGGLAHAHAMGVVHRDIKPENIMLEAGHAVIADFGIARAISRSGDAQALTKTGMSIGTPAYMSPEQATAEKDIDGRSDIYSLACVAYEMLAGAPPFTAPTMQALIARHLVDEVPALSTVRNTVSPEVEDAILQALEKVPADRFATAAQFAEALALGVGETGSWTSRHSTGRVSRHTRGGRATRGMPQPQVPAFSERRLSRALALAAAAAILVSLGAVGWVQFRKPAISAATTSGLQPNHLGVLYFDDNSPGKTLAYLADGLTESLIDALSQVHGLEVASRNATAQFRGNNVAPDSVARALRVGTLVRGAIEPVGSDSVRVQVRLVDGESGDDVGQQRAAFTLPLARAAAARDSIAGRVADALRPLLGSAVELRAERAGEVDDQAWLLLRRAERLRKDAEAARRGSDSAGAAQRFSTADSLLALAQSLDQKWAEPAILRGTIALEQAQRVRDPLIAAPLVDSGLVHAQRALAIDPRNPAALELRGTLTYARVDKGIIKVKGESDRAIADAERDLLAAVAIEPERATALNTLSRVQYSKQNVPQSHLYASRAYEADAYLSAAPSIVWRLFATSYDMEQFSDASTWCDEGGRRWPADGRFMNCRLLLLMTKAFPPDVPQAWKLVDRMVAITPAQDSAYKRREASIFTAIVIARRPELVDSARRVLERSRAGRDLDPRDELVGYEALARTLMGEREKALDLLERYLVAHPDHRAGFGKVNAWWWRNLQGEPRFKALVGIAG